jgi:hypothetical protein
MLRVGPLGVRWSLRVVLLGKQTRWDLGSAADLDPESVRKIAREARELCRQGIDPTDFIRRATGQAIDPGGVPVEPAAPKVTTWTFATAVDEFLTEKARTRADATLDDYRWKLVLEKEWIPLRDRPIASITDAEVQGVLDRIGKRGAYTAAEGIHRVVRALWNWLAQPGQREKSGVAKAVISDVKPPDRPREKPENTVEAPVVIIQQSLLPTHKEMGRIIAAAHMRAMPLYLSTAIELTCRTAQRRLTVVRCSYSQIERIRQEIPGIKDVRTKFVGWSVPPYFMKGRAKNVVNQTTMDHLVPITSEMFEKLMDCRVESAQVGDWFFPATRARRAGQELKYPHTNPSTLTHAFSWIPDVSCSPHDVRRAIATYGQHELGFTELQAQLILDHSEGRAASVLGKHYDRHAFIAEKVEMMAKWNSWLDEQAKEVWRTEEIFSDKAALLAAIEERRGEGFRTKRDEVKTLPLGVVGIIDFRAQLAAGRGEPRPGEPIVQQRKRPRVEKLAREMSTVLQELAGDDSGLSVREQAEKEALDRARGQDERRRKLRSVK